MSLFSPDNYSANLLMNHPGSSDCFAYNPLNSLILIVAENRDSTQAVRCPLPQFAANGAIRFQHSNDRYRILRFIKRSHLEEDRVIHSLRRLRKENGNRISPSRTDN